MVAARERAEAAKAEEAKAKSEAADRLAKAHERAKETATGEDDKMNASSNKSDWEKFGRQLKRYGTKSVYLSKELKRAQGKGDMFKLWMTKGEKDVAKLAQVLVQRSQEDRNTAKKGLTQMKEKQIKEMYTGEKATRVMNQAKAAGLCCPDSYFPDDRSEDWYWVKVAGQITSEQIASESTTLQCSRTVDADEVEEMVEDGGLLSMNVFAESSGGDVLQHIDNSTPSVIAAVGGDAPQPEKTPEEKAAEREAAKKRKEEEQASMTKAQQAKQLLEKIMKESNEARKYSIALAHFEFSAGLTAQMASHSARLDVFYEELQLLTLDEAATDAKYLAVFGRIAGAMEWYKVRQPVAEAMYKRINGNKKGEKGKGDQAKSKKGKTVKAPKTGK